MLVGDGQKGMIDRIQATFMSLTMNYSKVAGACSVCDIRTQAATLAQHNEHVMCVLRKQLCLHNITAAIQVACSPYLYDTT